MNPRDSYALLSQANIMYNVSVELRKMPDKEENELKKALDLYMKVLEIENNNVFATLGIGNILGEFGKVNEAQEIFKIVREHHPNTPYPMINSAHLYLAQVLILS